MFIIHNDHGALDSRWSGEWRALIGQHVGLIYSPVRRIYTEENAEVVAVLFGGRTKMPSVPFSSK